MAQFDRLLADVSKNNFSMYNQDFLLTWDKSPDDLRATIATAEALKYLHENNVSTQVFRSGLAVAIFRDQSTRTRFSFASASNLLGLTVQDLDEGKSQIAHGETVRETANMISFLTEAIGIRDDKFLGAGNAYMREVGEALDDGFKNGVLHQRPGIVNLQCDIDHPTQSMADLMHLKNYFGSLEALNGKRLAMTWAYSPSYGKPLSVPQGIIGLMSRFGMKVVLAYPEGYDLIPDCIKIAEKHAKESGGTFQVTHSMEEAFNGADIVYPKSWAPYGIMERRTEYLRSGNHEGLKELEREALSNNARFKSWTCTESLMQSTQAGEALYMHCLPADISGVSCSEGEVEKSVFEKFRIQTYREAGYKPFVIAAMVLLNRFKNADSVLGELYHRKFKRVGL